MNAYQSRTDPAFYESQDWIIRRMEREEWRRKNTPLDAAHAKAEARRFTGEPLTGFGELDQQHQGIA